MIKIESIKVEGWEPAIRGMRNPMNSWDKSDSLFYEGFNERDGSLLVTDIPGQYYSLDDKDDDERYDWLDVNDVYIGSNDHNLMLRLASSGSEHSKYRRMIVVWVDITAPLYWWKEFDTYKVGTVANSCSTMHKIHAKEFTLDDFSFEKVEGRDEDCTISLCINVLNTNREKYLETKDKKYWWNMIQLLPSSYNQKRTVMLNYEVLAHIYQQRKEHKLDEWREFCEQIKTLPYSEIITLEET